MAGLGWAMGIGAGAARAVLELVLDKDGMEVLEDLP